MLLIKAPRPIIGEAVFKLLWLSGSGKRGFCNFFDKTGNLLDNLLISSAFERFDSFEAAALNVT